MNAPTTPQPEPEQAEASDPRTDTEATGRVTELGPDAQQRRTEVAPEAKSRTTR